MDTQPINIDELMADFAQPGQPDPTNVFMHTPLPSTTSVNTFSSTSSIPPLLLVEQLEGLAREFRFSLITNQLRISGPTTPPAPLTPYQFRRTYPIWGSLLELMAAFATASLYYEVPHGDRQFLAAFSDESVLRGFTDRAFGEILAAHSNDRRGDILEIGK
jgi:hypothetical protein